MWLWSTVICLLTFLSVFLNAEMVSDVWPTGTLTNVPVLGGHAMVSNANNTGFYVFGGQINRTAVSNQLFHFDMLQTSFVLRNSQVTPSARMFHTLVRSTTEPFALLFGGFTLSGSATLPMNDTWSLDLRNGTWRRMQQVYPADAAVWFPLFSMHTMAYDANTNVFLLYGTALTQSASQANFYRIQVNFNSGTFSLFAIDTNFFTVTSTHSLLLQDANNDPIFIVPGAGLMLIYRCSKNYQTCVSTTPSVSTFGPIRFGAYLAWNPWNREIFYFNGLQTAPSSQFNSQQNRISAMYVYTMEPTSWQPQLTASWRSFASTSATGFAGYVIVRRPQDNCTVLVRHGGMSGGFNFTGTAFTNRVEFMIWHCGDPPTRITSLD